MDGIKGADISSQGKTALTANARKGFPTLSRKSQTFNNVTRALSFIYLCSGFMGLVFVPLKVNAIVLKFLFLLKTVCISRVGDQTHHISSVAFKTSNW